MFRFGAYVVHPTNAAADKKKQLFVVSPWEHADDTHGTYFTADHFSFVVNSNAPIERRLNFHQTTYVPHNFVPGEGAAVHTYNPLPTKFDLPASSSALARSGLFGERVPREYADTLLALFAHPFTAVGGGARKRRVAAAVKARKASGRSSRQFDDLWRELPIHSLLVIGLPNPDQQSSSSVTVFVTDRFNYSFARQRSAAAFTVSTDVLRDDAAMESRVAEALASLTWGRMRQQADV
jgi:hypothetical protein